MSNKEPIKVDLQQPIKFDEQNSLTVNVISPKKKKEFLPLLISLVSLVFSFGTFAFNYLDTNEQRIVSRNDFYSINASYLKIEKTDSMDIGEESYYSSSFKISNVSQHRVEILDCFTVLKNEDLSIINTLPNNLEQGSRVEYQGNHTIHLLPNESLLEYSYLTPNSKNNIEYFSFIVIYKNSIGGMYAIEFCGFYNVFFRDENKTPSATILMPLRNYFRVFKKEEFSLIESKIHSLK